MEEGTRYFRCGEQGHKKWKCIRKNEWKKEEVTPPPNVWKKI